MPQIWNDIVVVTKDELVPVYYNCWDSLKSEITRYKDKPYGIKRVQLGGNGRQMMIAFDSLPQHIKVAIGDPGKIDHPLERFYRMDGEAVTYFQMFRFDDGMALKNEYQDKYITNANMIQAIFKLKFAREAEWHSKGRSNRGIMAMLCSEAQSFQPYLKTKFNSNPHTLPENERRFKEALKEFEKDGYSSLISARHKNNNALKVTDKTLSLLNNMFAKTSHKPTPTEIHRMYQGFILGFVEVINSETGEMYNPKEFKELSERTVTNYMAQWANRIGNHAVRSGDRQKYMNNYKPHHAFEKAEFAGSLISVDDRQPPFKCMELGGERIWFYNGLDAASTAFTTFVHATTKKGLIVEFYRQMVRNYVEWGMSLPYELEAELSLNSSFQNTFLRAGAMFEAVHIEPNNARAKLVESCFNPLRNKMEKLLAGWQPRPFAKKESHQSGPGKVEEIPYTRIVEGCLMMIQEWNNEPHPVKSEMSRWKYFQTHQRPNPKPINWHGFLYHIGKLTETSCRVARIQLQNKAWLLGENSTVATGDKLINIMRQVEGKPVQVYWLDDSKGEVIKAHVYDDTQFICELVPEPKYARTKAEWTPVDDLNRELMSSYVNTIESFQRTQKRKLEQVTIIDNTPKQFNDYVIPELGQRKAHVAEILEDNTEEVDKEYERASKETHLERF